MGGHSCYEGGHRAHGGSPSPHTRENPVGGSSVHRGDIMIHVGDTMSTSGDFQYIRGIPWVYHGISWVYRGMFSTSEFSIEIERILSSCSPTCIMISLRCTELLPLYSWHPPDVLMVSLRCTEHPLMYTWYPPHSSWYPPDVWNIPRCTHDIPQMYWTPLDVLNIPRCTEHTLYRVKITWFSIFIKEYTIQKIKMSHNLSCLETRFRITVPLIIYCTATINSLSDSVSYTTFLFLKWCVHNHFVKIHSGFS